MNPFRGGRSAGATLAAALTIALCAGCEGNVIDGTGGGGGGGGTATTTGVATGGGGAACVSTGLYEVGPSVEIESATGFETPQHGDWPSVASNGDVHFATWSVGGRLLGARLGADGAPLDVPPKEIWSSSALLALAEVVWDGSAFVVVWTDYESKALRMTRVDPGSGELAEPVLLAEAGVNSTAGVHEGTTLVAWNDGATDDLLVLRIGQDGTPLDASPLLVATNAGGWHPITWNGSSFVVTWHVPGTGEPFATRITEDGEILDPAGVSLPFSNAVLASVGLADGSVHAWTEGAGEVLYVARLSASLEPVGEPEMIDFVANPVFEHISSLSLSRSVAGDLAIGWLYQTDTQTDQAAFAQELSPTLQPVGERLKRFGTVGDLRQSLVGLGGSDHLAVRAAEVLHAERLDSTGQGITGGGEHPIFLTERNKDRPVLAGDESGYLVVFREEDGAGTWDLRAMPLDIEGAPTGAPVVTLAKLDDSADYRVARSDSGHLVAHSGIAGMRLAWLSEKGELEEDFVLGTAKARRGTVACSGEVCLVAWSEQTGIDVKQFVVRVSGKGALLDAAPVLVVEAMVGDDGPSVVAGGGAFGVFSSYRAVRVGLDGAVTETPGFLPMDDKRGVPIAGSPTSFFAVRRDSENTDWLQVQDTEGALLGEHAPASGAAYPRGAAWDGTGYLFLAGDDKAFVITEDGGVAEPVDGIDIAYSSAASIASGGSGRAVVARGVPGARLSTQSLRRADSGPCDP